MDYLLCLELVQEACVGPSISEALKALTVNPSLSSVLLFRRKHSWTLPLAPWFFKDVWLNSHFVYKVVWSSNLVELLYFNFSANTVLEWCRYFGNFQRKYESIALSQFAYIMWENNESIVSKLLIDKLTLVICLLSCAIQTHSCLLLCSDWSWIWSRHRDGEIL